MADLYRDGIAPEPPRAVADRVARVAIHGLSDRWVDAGAFLPAEAGAEAAVRDCLLPHLAPLRAVIDAFAARFDTDPAAGRPRSRGRC